MLEDKIARKYRGQQSFGGRGMASEMVGSNSSGKISSPDSLSEATEMFAIS